MDFLYLIFYACLRLRFQDVETNPGTRCSVPAVCRILCSNVRGLAGLRLSMINCCALRLWCQICIRCRSYWLIDSVALSCCVWARCLGPEGDGCIRTNGAFRQSKFECGCCEMRVFRVCGVRQDLYVFSLYRNNDLDYQIFYFY